MAISDLNIIYVITTTVLKASGILLYLRIIFIKMLSTGITVFHFILIKTIVNFRA